ncbi:MAG: TetR/AcrR family transcriptional regulator [Cellvibrio sp.]|nr:TetR/AcrR family transcriptional regulator [Cellvibrio sp.]
MTSQEPSQPHTKDLVLNIFPAVMLEKGYIKMTVQDIIKRANIGRTTFYAHFTSKEDVLKGSIDRLRDNLLSAVSQNESGREGRLTFTYYFFDHIISHNKFYDDLVGRDDFFIVERYILRMLTDLLNREVKLIPGCDAQSSRAELMVQYLVGAIWATSIWTLERKHLSAKMVNECFHDMALPGLEKFIKTL